MTNPTLTTARLICPTTNGTNNLTASILEATVVSPAGAHPLQTCQLVHMRFVLIRIPATNLGATLNLRIRKNGAALDNTVSFTDLDALGTVHDVDLSTNFLANDLLTLLRQTINDTVDSTGFIVEGTIDFL